MQGVNTPHKVNTIPNNAKIHDANVSKQQLHTLPAVQADKVHAVGSNKLVPAVQPKNVHAVQSNATAIQANKKVAVQNFQPQHVNFHAQPNRAIPSVTYNQHYRINGSQNWTGNNYAVFRSVPSRMARPELVALASQSRRFDWWRVVLLECWILVSCLGIRYGCCLLSI